MSNTLDFTKICSSDESKLRKAEILIFSKGSLFVSQITGIHLPKTATLKILHNMSDGNKNEKMKKTKSFIHTESISSDMKKLESVTLELNGLSQNFYPLLISFWGKIYDGCNSASTKFKMISSLRNNSSNPTSFIFNKDGTMTMKIENINLETSFGIKTNCAKENEKLVAKIIIIYDPCV